MSLKNIKPHPLNVKPSGNALLQVENVPLHRIKTMGLFGLVSDEILISILEQLPLKDLLALGHTSKSLFAYCYFDELWKHVVYDFKNQAELKWHGSWRRTALNLSKEHEAKIDVGGLVFSDALHRPYELSNINYNDFIDMTRGAQIPLCDEDDLTVEKFDTELHNKPFVVKLKHSLADWTIDTLLELVGNQVFVQEYMDWPLKLYIDYCRENQDEIPLYLFDCKSKAHKILKFSPPLPEIFGYKRDLFNLFGEERPDHQWLIIGPERSGSTFHKDPNATSAWNSLICGHKYWIMFPASTLPPGVWTDSEQSEVTAPVSMAEWFASGLYEAALKSPGFCHVITSPGQVMYVPSGWWHAVINLDESIALTGNFVSISQLSKVLNFLKNKSGQVSGFRNTDRLYTRFVELIKEKRPDEAKLLNSKKRTWKDVVKAETPFTFQLF